MKNHFIILMSCLLFFSCSETNLNSLERHNLKGKVIKIEQHSYATKKEGDRWIPGEENSSGHFFLSFNEDGYLKENHTLETGNVILRKFVHSFKDGVLDASIVYNNAEEIIEKHEHISKNGNIIETKEFDASGNLKRTKKMKFKNGLPILQELFDNDILVKKIRSEYKNGQIIKQTTTDPSGKIIFDVHFELNKNNDDSSFTVFEGEEEVYKAEFEYEYDDHGNWVKQFDKVDGTASSIIVRNITYAE